MTYDRWKTDSGYYDITPEEEAGLDRDELVERIHRLEAELEAANHAIMTIRKTTINDCASLIQGCQHDGGFDRAIGPIGCYLELDGRGGCVCAGIATAIRQLAVDIPPERKD